MKRCEDGELDTLRGRVHRSGCHPLAGSRLETEGAEEQPHPRPYAASETFLAEQPLRRADEALRWIAEPGEGKDREEAD